MKHSTGYLALLVLIMLLGGCGQQGPLVLPQPQSTEPTAEPAQPAAPTNEQ